MTKVIMNMIFPIIEQHFNSNLIAQGAIGSLNALAAHWSAPSDHLHMASSSRTHKAWTWKL